MLLIWMSIWFDTLDQRLHLEEKTSQVRTAEVLFSREGIGLKEPVYETGLCFSLLSGQEADTSPWSPGLLVMLLLITAARCLSEGWLGIKQRARASTPHISSFCFQRHSLPSGVRTVHALSSAAPRLQSSAEASLIQCFLAAPPAGMAAAGVSSLSVKTSRLTFL